MSFSVLARKLAVQSMSYPLMAACQTPPSMQSPTQNHSSSQIQHQTTHLAISPVPATPPAVWDKRLRMVEAAVAALTAEVRRLRALIGDTRFSQANLSTYHLDTDHSHTTFSAPTSSPKSKRSRKSRLTAHIFHLRNA